MTASNLRQRRAVRAPFRLLAAVICLAGAVALFGTGYLVWKGEHALKVGDMVMLPGALWLFRLIFHAARRGDVPADAYWPFASPQVANGYFLFLMAFQIWFQS